MRYKASKMKFKKTQIPAPSPGLVITEPDQVVPDQSLTLKEILQRFVRHEALPVGNNANFGNGQDPEGDSPLNIDLEKAAHWDLTERDDFNATVAEMKNEFETQEKKKAAKAKAEAAEKRKADFQKSVEAEVEKRMKKGPADAGSI